MDVWVLAGQSNMQGFGLLNDPRVDMRPDPRVLQLTSSGTWAVAADPLQRLWESDLAAHGVLLRPNLPEDERHLPDRDLAHRERDAPRVGTGLGRAFGTAVADATGEAVLLVPTAHAGTTLEQWKAGFHGAPRDSTDTLYGALLDRVRRARAWEGAELKGILWYQGEADAAPTRAHDYAARFDSWVASVREDLGVPELPVHTVQLGRFVWREDAGDNTERDWDTIREAQRTLPSRVPHTSVVSAVDLAIGDSVHLDPPSLVRLGRRLAHVALTDGTGPNVDGVRITGPEAHGLWRIRIDVKDVTGGWHPSTHLPGFLLCDEHGSPMPRLKIVDARPDLSDPTSIELITTAWSADELAGVHVAYGLGYDPVCIAVDDADLPLPAFAPQPVTVSS